MGLLSKWEAEEVTASAREEGKRGGSSAGGGMEWKKQEGQGRQRKQGTEIDRLGHGTQYLLLDGGHPRHFRGEVGEGSGQSATDDPVYRQP